MTGWIKLDVLSLRMLSAIADAADIVEQQTGQRPDLNALRFDDSRVYDMICRGETVGVFQVESRAQASLIPRFQPRTFADLTIQIALSVPARAGQHGASLPSPPRTPNTAGALSPIRCWKKPFLQQTLGVILFQEQYFKGGAATWPVSRLVRASCSRRAQGYKRADQQIEAFRLRFPGRSARQRRAVAGCRTNLQTTQSVRQLFVLQGPRGRFRCYNVLVGPAPLLRIHRLLRRVAA